MRLALNLLLLMVGPVSCTPAVDLQPHDDQYQVCARRAGPERRSNDSDDVIGKIRQVVDATQMDGPVQIVVVDPRGDLKKLHFGSLYTRPGPSEQRLAIYQAIASSKPGDCVQAGGSVMSDGKLWVETFVNYDRP
jgi:hypothetical protein